MVMRRFDSYKWHWLLAIVTLMKTQKVKEKKEMKKEKMVTRSFKVTKATVMVVDMASCEVETRVALLSGWFTDDDKLLNECKNQLETQLLKVVSVTYKEEFEKLYGMSENEFITHATELEPRTKKDKEN